MNNKEWIQTYTGRKFYPLRPRTEDICIEDIAHALAMKCRFSGHCKRFYSVAEHSTLVSRLVAKKLSIDFGDAVRWGLLHDAGEAYLPDVPSPIKHRFPYLIECEEYILKTVAVRFGLTWPVPQVVDEADKFLCLDVERKIVMMEGPAWQREESGYDFPEPRINFLSPENAEFIFLDLFKDIFN